MTIRHSLPRPSRRRRCVRGAHRGRRTASTPARPATRRAADRRGLALAPPARRRQRAADRRTAPECAGDRGSRARRPRPVRPACRRDTGVLDRLLRRLHRPRSGRRTADRRDASGPVRWHRGHDRCEGAGRHPRDPRHPLLLDRVAGTPRDGCATRPLAGRPRQRQRRTDAHRAPQRPPANTHHLQRHRSPPNRPAVGPGSPTSSGPDPGATTGTPRLDTGSAPSWQPTHRLVCQRRRT